VSWRILLRRLELRAQVGVPRRPAPGFALRGSTLDSVAGLDADGGRSPGAGRAERFRSLGARLAGGKSSFDHHFSGFR
jgi:hypothetical protein